MMKVLAVLLAVLPAAASTVVIGSQEAPSSDPWCGS
jgi:hypothetical protein